MTINNRTEEVSVAVTETSEATTMEITEADNQNTDMKTPQQQQDTEKKVTNFKSRIDRFCLTSKVETNYKIRTQIIQNYLSDHRMITLNTHKRNEKKRGPSYWKLNSSILENKDHKNKISSFGENGNKEKKNTKILPSGVTTETNLLKA